MKNNNSTAFIFFSVMYLICISILYVLKYYDLLLLMIVFIIVVMLFLLLLNSIKFQYKLLNKKAILYADIANSKMIKLFFGNDKEIMNKVYDVLLDNLDNGFVKRLQSDHYVILMDYRSKNDIVNFIENVNNDIKDLVDGDMFIVSLKFGIQICDKEGYDANVTKAALACNKAKTKTLMAYSYYEEEDSLNQMAEKKLIDSLIKSLKNNEFEVYYQPKYNYKLKKIVGSEALIRLVQNGEVMSASKFIDISEKYGFTVFLDKFVLKEVCKKIKELKKEKIEFNTISINVSRNTLSEKSMIDYYLKVLKQYDVKKSEIELEVTERNTLDNTFNLNDTIHELCKNFNVSIDDFGVGSSSLSMLQEKKIKTIKIDREFIIDSSVSGRKLLSNIIKLTTDLGFDVIAEGVETIDQYEFLKSKGCNIIQGYYYSKPLCFKDYKKLLKGE